MTAARQLLERLSRCPLLGFLLAPADAAAKELAPDHELDRELLVVVRAGLGRHAVVRKDLEALLAKFLERGLMVDRAAGPGLDDGFAEEAGDEIAGLRKAAIQVEGGHKRLKAVGEQGVLVPAAGLLFAPAHQQIFAEEDRAGHCREGRLAYDGRPEAGKLAFRSAGLGVHDKLAYDEVEDGVPQEFHPLVVLGQAVLVGVGSVGKRALQQSGITESVCDLLLELAEGTHVRAGTS